jgi:uncharacterized protein YndB with AHSA1/START domain
LLLLALLVVSGPTLAQATTTAIPDNFTGGARIKVIVTGLALSTNYRLRLEEVRPGIGGVRTACENSRHLGQAQETQMTDESGTVRLHRVLRAPADRIYKAFTDKAALERWVPPFGFTGTIHEIDVRVGGGYRMSFTNFGTGSSHSFTVTFTEMVPGERIRHTDQFDDANLPGEMRVSVDFTPVICGTEIRIVQEGIPSVIPVEMCYLGWQESLQQLAQLVEPDIPDNG